MDRVQFVMEANDGHTRGTVEAVASSGEKSRLLLLLETSLPPPPAIVPVRQRADGAGEKASSGWEQPQSVEDKKCVGIDKISKADKITPRVVPCAVLYDEIDAHVGGRTAVAVGRLLANQGRESQVREAFPFIDTNEESLDPTATIFTHYVVKGTEGFVISGRGITSSGADHFKPRLLFLRIHCWAYWSFFNDAAC